MSSYQRSFFLRLLLSQSQSTHLLYIVREEIIYLCNSSQYRLSLSLQLPTLVQVQQLHYSTVYQTRTSLVVLTHLSTPQLLLPPALTPHSLERSHARRHLRRQGHHLLQRLSSLRLEGVVWDAGVDMGMSPQHYPVLFLLFARSCHAFPLSAGLSEGLLVLKCHHFFASPVDSPHPQSLPPRQDDQSFQISIEYFREESREQGMCVRRGRVEEGTSFATEDEGGRFLASQLKEVGYLPPKVTPLLSLLHFTHFICMETIKNIIGRGNTIVL